MNRTRAKFFTMVLLLSCMLVIGFWISAAKVRAIEDVLDSPLFAYSAELADKRLGNPYWRIESREYQDPESDLSGDQDYNVKPLATSGICPLPTIGSTCLPTCAATCGTKLTCADTCGTNPTCALTCGSTCAATCGAKPTCSSTCLVTCATTCGTKPTCADTCSATCGTKPTCSSTCLVTCGATCGTKPTCSSTCLVTCAATCGTKATCAETCAATCGATCGTKPTCAATCGATCGVGPTCGISPTCSSTCLVTCAETCGTNPTCASTCGSTCAATCGTSLTCAETCAATCTATCGTSPTCAATCSVTCGSGSTCAETCAATCGATCHETCGGRPTCESGCGVEHATTGTTCSPTPTCAATCGQGMSTCSATCKGYYTCVPTCGSAATCNRTCGDQPTCYLPAIACPVRPPLAPVDNGVPLTEIARFNAGAKGSKNPAWAADGSGVFFASAGKGLRELDAMTGNISEVSNNPSDERPEPGRTESAFAYLSKGKIVFEIDGKKEKSTSAGTGWTISEIEWNLDSILLRYIARGSGGHKVGVFDPRSGSHKTLHSIKGGNLFALTCAARSYQFFVLQETQSGSKIASSVLALSEDGTVNELFSLPGTISAMQVSPNGMFIYYVMDRTIYCFDRSTGLHRVLAEKAGDSLEISPCGEWLMTNPAGLAVCPSSGGRLKQIISAPGITEFVWSIRGQIAVISNMNGHSELWLFRIDDEVVS